MKRIKSGKIKQHKSKKKIIWITIVCILAAFFLIIMPVLTVIVYQDNFGGRYETSEWIFYTVDEFEGLEVSECTFPSDKGQLLAGYKYSKKNQQIKGVVVIAHGLGSGGQNTYMDIADYFASNGYLVFAYDATGNDKSEGDSLGGLPQGVVDLDYALRYVREVEEYRDLPVVLYGHSWGGYSVGNVLNYHPDVSAVVIVAGFNRSGDLFEHYGEAEIGLGIQLFMPYVSIYERLKFGNYAACSAIDGFADSDAGIMVLHSKDDTEVPPEYGYDVFYDRYGDDSRFCFIEYEDRGHSYICYSEAARNYREELYEEYGDYVEANGGEYNDDIKAEFMEGRLDKSKCYEFDYDLMQRILEFCDYYCEKI